MYTEIAHKLYDSLDSSHDIELPDCTNFKDDYALTLMSLTLEGLSPKQSREINPNHGQTQRAWILEVGKQWDAAEEEFFKNLGMTRGAFFAQFEPCRLACHEGRALPAEGMALCQAAGQMSVDEKIVTLLAWGLPGVDGPRRHEHKKRGQLAVALCYLQAVADGRFAPSHMDMDLLLVLGALWNICSSKTPVPVEDASHLYVADIEDDPTVYIPETDRHCR